MSGNACPPRRPAGLPKAHPRGFGAIAILVVLVLLAALAAAVVRLGGAQQTGSAQAISAARAAQAARAGLEWGLYQAFHGAWSACAGVSQTLDLGADLGMRATVSCRSRSFNEGLQDDGVSARSVRVYVIEAVACNGSATCPDDGRAAQPGYVERRVQVSATE